MAEITAALVKELREISGAGMMDCKKALVETSGNLDEASDWLRKKGLAAAQEGWPRRAEGWVARCTGGSQRARCREVTAKPISLPATRAVRRASVGR